MALVVLAQHFMVVLVPVAPVQLTAVAAARVDSTPLPLNSSLDRMAAVVQSVSSGQVTRAFSHQQIQEQYNDNVYSTC
jgi:hypothetical protein